MPTLMLRTFDAQRRDALVHRIERILYTRLGSVVVRHDREER